MASTLGYFVIPQRVFLAWMPSINKKCHQNHFLGVLEIIGCRLLAMPSNYQTLANVIKFRSKTYLIEEFGTYLLRSKVKTASTEFALLILTCLTFDA